MEMQSVKTTRRELSGARRVTNWRRPAVDQQLKTATAALEDLYVPSLSSSTTCFYFPSAVTRPPSLSILLFLLHFSLSYTLLPGESDGGLVPRYTRRSRPAGTLPSCPSLRTCARDQSMEGLRKRFDGVQTGDTGSFSQTSLTGRRPGRSISSSNIFVYPVSVYYPSVRPRSTTVLTRRNVVQEELDGQQRERERYNKTFNLKREAFLL